MLSLGCVCYLHRHTGRREIVPSTVPSQVFGDTSD